MTLFKVLTSKDGEGGGTQSSSSPPEAIQLHSNRVIDFLHGTTVNLNPNSKNSGGEGKKNDNQPAGVVGGVQQQQSRYYSALSYQAIQTQRDFDGLTSSSSKSSSATGHQRPDLGVWDCRINNETNGEASAMLLKRVVMNDNNKILVESKEENVGEEKKGKDGDQTTTCATKSPPIVMTVDLSDPTSVQPTIEQMRSVILNMYDEKSSASSEGQSSATTTIKALQSSIFGKTLIQEEVTVKGGTGNSSEPRIALIMAVIVQNYNNKASSSSTADEYKERQERALLLYHLHKFALEVNCTLCFVGAAASANAESGQTGEEEKDESSTGNNNDPLLGRSTTMSIDELSVVIRRVAMELSPVEESNVILDQSNEEEKGESNENEGKEEDDDTKQQRPPSIYVPGSHDAELIHGAYLRNASCEGFWDASKDDLNVALPPRTPSTTAKEETKDEKNVTSGSSGDEEWLSQLASSIGLSPESAASVLSPKASSSSAGERSLTPERSKKKERSAVKKRVTRGASTRNKEAKTPKDEKEVLNFFDNLLKK